MDHAQTLGSEYHPMKHLAPQSFIVLWGWGWGGGRVAIYVYNSNDLHYHKKLLRNLKIFDLIKEMYNKGTL